MTTSRDEGTLYYDGERRHADQEGKRKAGSFRGTSAGRVDFPQSNRFNGVRDAKEVDNFLWQMEQYDTLKMSLCHCQVNNGYSNT